MRRPLTHDLLKNVLDELDHVARPRGRDRGAGRDLPALEPRGRCRGSHPSSRPSGGSPSPSRTQTPIFRRGGAPGRGGPGAGGGRAGREGDEDELLEDFRDFIEPSSPRTSAVPDQRLWRSAKVESAVPVRRMRLLHQTVRSGHRTAPSGQSLRATCSSSLARAGTRLGID